MKILLITPGSGDAFYCSNCFRDSLYAQALRNAGHQITIMPLYLPLMEKSLQTDIPLFFPATSFYVAQKFFKKGKMPHFFENILNSTTLLRWATSLSGTTSAKGMEEMTLSMITGDGENFSKQSEKIIYWLENHEKPDIIHLSTSLLAGIAKAIKNSTNIPIVCSLQDEEVWIESLENRFAEQAWRAIGQNSAYINQFITTSEYYKSVAFNKIPEIKEIDVVYPGVNIETYKSLEYPKNPTIGFYYRMNYENGLDILAQAFVKLKKENRVANLKLKIGGGYTRENKKFLRHIQTVLKPYMNDVTFSRHYSLDEHTTFYKDISLICTPLRFNQAFGLYLSEAFATGRPAVAPDTGSFKEIIGDAGILYTPNTSEELAEALLKLLTNGALYRQCKEQALQLSREKYNDTTVAQRLLQIYDKL